jgi:N-methylhydantoinase A
VESTLEDARVHNTRYFWDGEWYDAVIYDRGRLREGQLVPGPSIVVEMDATTLILPGFEAGVDAIGNLLINPINKGEKAA